MNKISETLLEFAQPIIETLPPNPTLQMRRLALEIAATVWNAIVIEAWGGEGKELGPGTLTELKERLAGLPEPIGTTMGPIIERLAQSKRTRYAGDLRSKSPNDGPVMTAHRIIGSRVGLLVKQPLRG